MNIFRNGITELFLNTAKTHKLFILCPLVIAADGRFSKFRDYLPDPPITIATPMDILWFRIPKTEDKPLTEAGFIAKQGRLLVTYEHNQDIQAGLIIFKNEYEAIRRQGLDSLKNLLIALAPHLKTGIETLNQWSNFNYLKVKAERMKTWYRPGLLLIGDAAHTMSPVGGVGVNYAIQDAVVAANELHEPLLVGQILLKDLERVQRQRELPVKVIQAFQAFLQKQIIERSLNSNQSFQQPFFLRLPFVNRLVPQILAFGLFPVKLK